MSDGVTKAGYGAGGEMEADPPQPLAADDAMMTVMRGGEKEKAADYANCEYPL